MNPDMDGLLLVDKVSDGDSVNGSIHIDLTEFDGWIVTAWKQDRFRLINLDTPERGEPTWARAKADLTTWLRWPGRNLRVRTYGRDAFGRVLADIYDRETGATATQHMLSDDCGWLPWVPS